jgi:branched-chain amino acid transport system ATP-binding protein
LVKEGNKLLLEVINLSVSYDKAVLLSNVSLRVQEGELVSLVGPNGAGKSTLLRAISGLVQRDKEITKRSATGEVRLTGEILFLGENILRLKAHEIAQRGLIHCPERRRPFRELTVKENLLAGAYLIRDKRLVEENMERVYELFPRLRERGDQVSGTMSGGEQQMLAIARALMGRPKLLCIDEPSTGLAPIVRTQVFETIQKIHSSGVPVLLVEQDVATVFKMTHKNYVLSSGKIIAQGPGEELLKDDVLKKTYLGL